MTTIAIILCLMSVPRDAALFDAGAKWTITAYCPCRKCCGPSAHGITASGKRVAVGMCAADPSIPFGTRLKVEGIGTFTVEDRGGAIRGRHIDIYLPTHKSALAFGVRRAKVEVEK